MKARQYKVIKLKNNKLKLEVCREFSIKHSLDSAEKVFQFCNDSLKLQYMAEEFIYLFVMNPKCMVIGIFELSHGAIDYTIAPVRELMIKVLLCGGTGFILVHNHPSGECSPSKEDLDVTKRVKDASELLGIKFLDHLIVGGTNFYSLKKIIV